MGKGVVIWCDSTAKSIDLLIHFLSDSELIFISKNISWNP